MCSKDNKKYRVVLTEAILNLVISHINQSNNKIQVLNDLMGKDIKIMDTAPIYINQVIQELRITQPEQIIIK